MKHLYLSITILTISTSLVTAFPRLQGKDAEHLAKLAAITSKCPLSAKQGNECPYSATKKHTKRQVSFDAATQHVSTTGEHAWVAPNFAAGDQRGPCPGLNALANHGYLPHSGVAPMTTIVDAVNTGGSRSFIDQQPCTQFSAILPDFAMRF